MIRHEEHDASIKRDLESIVGDLASLIGSRDDEQPPSILMVYVPIRGEIDPIHGASWAVQAGWTLAIGRALTREAVLQPVQVSPAIVEGGRWNLDGAAQ